MGGEGGGVLADWLVDLAEHNGHLAQSTSVPGVAQRTGATIYYVELFERAAVPAGAQPVFALSPVPGEVDIVVASELMEAGRALQRQLVTPARTTLVASTHRVYSMTERTAMGDGRVDADKLVEGARGAARRFIGADFACLAERCGSPISPVLCGALAASGALPFTREQWRRTIERGGVGVAASLAAFDAGFDAASAPDAAGRAAAASDVGASPGPLPGPLPGPRLAALSARIAAEFPPAAQPVLRTGIVRLADYQDVAYAGEYLDRLRPLAGARVDVLGEAARHLALWMSYEDTVRVADLKTRRTRFDRVAGEVRLQGATQQLEISEFLHPRIEEVADTLPAGWGRWLLGSATARAWLAPLLHGRVVTTSSLRGYLLLYAVASLRRWRRGSLRHAVERQRIDAWLALVQRLAAARPDLAREVARSQRLVKGYGDTHARGWRNHQRLMQELPRLESASDGARQLHDLIEAALADDTGRTLDNRLAATATA